LAFRAGQIGLFIRTDKKLFKKVTAFQASEFKNGHFDHSSFQVFTALGCV